VPAPMMPTATAIVSNRIEPELTRRLIKH
jgi:hypothetical protein